MKRKVKLFVMVASIISVLPAFAQTSGDGTIKDTRDNQVYETIKIGSHWWMAENLNFDAGEGSWCYNNDPEACKHFGMLYAWETAKNVCLSGWHLPSDKEWQDLEKELGMPGNSLDQMGWRTIELDLLYNEENGLKIVNAGYRPFGDGTFDDGGDDAYFWTSTEKDKDHGWKRFMDDHRMQIGRGYDSKKQGFSVRCIKD